MGKKQIFASQPAQGSSLVHAAGQMSAIIQIQSEVIDELFLLLMQHISAEEAGQLPCVGKINLAAQLRYGVEEEIG